MKVMFAYPPLESEKGTPLLSQNRQFQWFHNPTYIYPMVPAMGATLLREAGFDVIWADGIAEKWDYQYFLKLVLEEKPDLIVIESKTPVIKNHWKIVEELKILAGDDWDLKTVLIGDHITALPEESMKESQVDYLLTGGDADFLLLNLCQHLTQKENLEPGIWYRKKIANGKWQIANTGQYRLDHDLTTLPFIDRDLTKWKLYAYDNGNFKRKPGTYTMVGRDCWWAKCTFCSWTTLFPKFRTRTPQSLLYEIEILINKYHIMEVMDDTGTFPAGRWLEDFCQGMMAERFNQKINFNCNMRFGRLNQKQYNLMAKAGFRFILYGLESGNQSTLDRLQKGIKVQDIIDGCKMAKKAGLMPHLTVMVGYPWEGEKEVEKTLKLAKNLFEKGLADSLQATVVIPYPGTPLFNECLKNNCLTSLNWNDYDMTKPIMKTNLDSQKIMELSRNLYSLAFSPKFLLRKTLSIHDLDDMKYYLRAGKAVIGHILDFKRGQD